MGTQRITPESRLMKPATRLTVFAAVALGAFLLYSTLAAQKSACNVCVSFKGGRNCAHASAETAKEATKSAQTTACGPIAHGMAESIECDNIPPDEVTCEK
jgi:hypothetical protein